MTFLWICVFKVTKAHAGNYTCRPYNLHGTSGTSGIMKVNLRDPTPEEEEEYIRRVGLPCSQRGDKTLTFSWYLSDTRLKKQDYELYECAVSSLHHWKSSLNIIHCMCDIFFGMKQQIMISLQHNINLETDDEPFYVHFRFTLTLQVKCWLLERKYLMHPVMSLLKEKAHFL